MKKATWLETLELNEPLSSLGLLSPSIEHKLAEVKFEVEGKPLMQFAWNVAQGFKCIYDPWVGPIAPPLKISVRGAWDVHVSVNAPIELMDDAG